LHNTTGADNTASGFQTLQNNTTGNFNTATGELALGLNTTGVHNTADGQGALFRNTNGGSNTASGLHALFNNTTGSNNLAMGTNAGVNLTTGNNNIDIGNLGVATESNTIRVGIQGLQKAAFIAGIFGSSATGDAVVVSNTGKLGIVLSSARFKRDIHDMADSSEALMKLRPVTFKYKNDPEGIKQYGLVAEEVARIYPELVSYGTDGKVETVRYLTLTAMLLNELQKQTRENAQQAEQIRRMSVQLAGVKAAFEDRLSRLEQTTRAKNEDERLTAAR
jgi:hypothetical protein